MNHYLDEKNKLEFEIKINIKNQYYCVLVITFLVYLILLTQGIIYKFNIAELTPNRIIHDINLVPFRLNGEIIIIGTLKQNLERLFNIVAFIPFGIYLGLLFPKTKFYKLLVPITLTSLLYELFQLFSGYGYTEVTDLITNSLGGLIGIGLCRLLAYKLISRRSILNINKFSLWVYIPLVIIIFNSIQTNSMMFK